MLVCFVPELLPRQSGVSGLSVFVKVGTFAASEVFVPGTGVVLVVALAAFPTLGAGSVALASAQQAYLTSAFAADVTLVEEHFEAEWNPSEQPQCEDDQHCHPAVGKGSQRVFHYCVA